MKRTLPAPSFLKGALPAPTFSQILVEGLCDLAFDSLTVCKTVELFEPDQLDAALDWAELAQNLDACLTHVLRAGAGEERATGGAP